jgi:dephospho-CoA kinase
VLNVGLTGGIGAGKSEVARRFAELGAVLVDADRLARDAVAPGTRGLAAVCAEFGRAVLGPDGSLDRERMAALVFTDAGARARLNAIVHPLVAEATVAAVGAAPPGSVIVHDVPLLVEAGLVGSYDAIVVVAASPTTQLDRLVRVRGFAPDDAHARIAAQAPLADKLAVADYVIANDGPLAALDAQVRTVWADLRARLDRASDG